VAAHNVGQRSLAAACTTACATASSCVLAVETPCNSGGRFPAARAPRSRRALTPYMRLYRATWLYTLLLPGRQSSLARGRQRRARAGARLERRLVEAGEGQPRGLRLELRGRQRVVLARGVCRPRTALWIRRRPAASEQQGRQQTPSASRRPLRLQQACWQAGSPVQHGKREAGTRLACRFNA